MLVCCNRQMKVEKNGVGVEVGSEVHPGDRFVCTSCHRTVIQTWEGDGPSGLVDPEHTLFPEYIILKQ